MCLLQICSSSLWFVSFSWYIAFQREVFILIKFNLSIITFMDLVFGGVSNKSWPCQRSPGLLSVIFQEFNNFMLRSMTYFDLIFVKGEVFVQISFFACGFQWCQHHRGKDDNSSILLPLLLCQRSGDYICVSLSGFPILFH